MPKNLPTLDLDYLVNGYEKGMSINDLACYYGVSPSTIRNRIAPVIKLRERSNGIGKRGIRIKFDDEGEPERVYLVESIKDLYFNKGMNVYDIHKRLGVMRCDVNLIVKQEINKILGVDKVLGAIRYCEICGVLLSFTSDNKTCGKSCANILRGRSLVQVNRYKKKEEIEKKIIDLKRQLEGAKDIS